MRSCAAHFFMGDCPPPLPSTASVLGCRPPQTALATENGVQRAPPPPSLFSHLQATGSSPVPAADAGNALVGLATCHSAEKCGDVIVASEVEFKMFEATGWKFTSPDGATPVVLESPAGASYTVLQRNDFDNTRQTQSVVVQGPGGACDIYVKVRGGGEWVVRAPPPNPANFSSRSQPSPRPPNNSHTRRLSSGLVRGHRPAVQAVVSAAQFGHRGAQSGAAGVLRAGSGDAFAWRLGAWRVRRWRMGAPQCGGQRAPAQQSAAHG